MRSPILALHLRPRAALLAAALCLTAVMTMSAPESAHACRPDMDLWSPHCGAP